jgi:hypothetical protein
MTPRTDQPAAQLAEQLSNNERLLDEAREWLAGTLTGKQRAYWENIKRQCENGIRLVTTEQRRRAILRLKDSK